MSGSDEAEPLTLASAKLVICLANLLFGVNWLVDRQTGSARQSARGSVDNMRAVDMECLERLSKQRTSECLVAAGGAAKLRCSAPWCIYSEDRVPDLDAEARTRGSDSGEADP